MRELRDKGTKVIAIDPVHHATAKALGLPCYRVNTDEAALEVLGEIHSQPWVKSPP